MKFFKNQIILRKDFLIPLLIFSVIFLPFLNTIPFLDGNIDFIQSIDFKNGGFVEYFKNWNSVHPPVKLLLTGILFYFFGANAFTYNLLGYIVGIFSIISFYFLSKKIFNNEIAKINSFLLASFPLFLSTSIFSLRDFILSCFLIASLMFYSRKKVFLAAIFTTLAILTKETAMLLLIAFIIVEVIFLRHKRITHLLFFGIPFLFFYSWNYYLQINNKNSWQEWLFSENASSGTVDVILNNLINFQFLNIYAYQHWKQLFFLNFNWVYWLFAIIGIFTGVKKIIFKKNFVRKEKIKPLLVIFIFCSSYLMTVLSLQTYTIPRYALPILVFMLIPAGFGLNFLTKVFKVKLFYFIPSLIFLLFFSFDPISRSFWGQTKVLDQEFYGVNNYLAGNDGITYNLQYLLVAGKRSKILRMDSYFDLGQCGWLFADINNDKKTAVILKDIRKEVFDACSK